jgi:hypothetical protein
VFLGSLVGISLIALKKLDRSTPIAFGPFILIAGFFSNLYARLLQSANEFVNWLTISIKFLNSRFKKLYTKLVNGIQGRILVRTHGTIQ